MTATAREDKGNLARLQTVVNQIHSLRFRAEGELNCLGLGVNYGAVFPSGAILPDLLLPNRNLAATICQHHPKMVA